MLTDSIRKKHALVAVAFIMNVVMITACRQQEVSTQANDGEKVKIKYATGFTVRKDGTKRWVEIKTPYQGAKGGITYLVIPKDEPLPVVPDNVKVIRTPIQSIVCTSTSHLPLLDYLNESDKLIGFPQTDYISSDNIRKRVDQGKVTDLGVENSMNIERLMSLRPELVMGYAVTSDYGQFKKIEELGIPVVLNSEYLEGHPLGRAEWIKFMALFFNKEKEADSIFQAIELSYLDTRQKAETVSHRPLVMSGIIYGDTWFMPGGQNYAARIFKDAGCKYLWEDDPSSGFLELDFESVFEKGREADLWIGVGSNETLRALGDSDHRYKFFKVYKEGNVYNSDARKGEKGGSVYLELGYLRPDIILQDLVKIAHPDLLPGHTLYFHRRLR